MTVSLISTYAEAVAFLDGRVGYGVRPGLERMEALLDLMTHPQESYPSVHVAGTNGKTTVVWMTEALLAAHGLLVGSYTSPHLEVIQDRFRIGGRGFDEADFAAAVADAAPFIEIYEEGSGESVTYFETTVAVAFQAIAAAGADAAVIEVGLGGRLDATNLLESEVSVITGIALDHTKVLGNSLGEIAAEKAGIVPTGGRLVTGPLPAAAEGPITARVVDTGSTWYRSGEDFVIDDATRALGGWRTTIEGLYATYEDVFLPLHGRHQVDHLATAVVAAELFLRQALDADAAADAVGAIAAPGRIEVVGRRPLVIVDGSHNVEGLEGLAGALLEEFPDAPRTLVVGFRGSRDPVAMMRPFEGLVSRVVATRATDALAVPGEAVAEAATEVLGDIPVDVITPVSQAVAEAVGAAAEDDIVVIAGSLYVAGEARLHLLGG